MKASRIDQGTVAVRQTGSFTIQTAITAIQSISHCKIIQKADGYAFFSHPTWTQLLLVFALPFKESTDEILAKLARSTLEEASQRKLL